MSNSAINQGVLQAKISNVQNQADSSAVYSAGAWSFKNASAVTSVTIDNSGNVGVGTTSPAVKFHVAQAGSLSSRVENTASATDTSFEVKNTAQSIIIGTDSTSGYIAVNNSKPLYFYTASTERMRIEHTGTVAITSNMRLYRTAAAQGSALAQFDDGTTVSFLSYVVTSGGWNAAATATIFGRNSVTLRSINAGGTVNASGADYAEYMTKAGDFTIAKGDICGINAEGKLTKTFSEAVTFVVKSTNPSYVGGDSWGAGLEADSEELEAARQLVDRIAFCGQIPVNVLGATPGQWIIPIEDNDEIKGEAVSNPSFEQYQKSVGKVIAIEQDGRARIIVKVA